MSKLMVVCAWCQKELEEKEGEGTEGESHGICDDCLRQYFPHHYDRIIGELEVDSIDEIYKEKPDKRG